MPGKTSSYRLKTWTALFLTIAATLTLTWLIRNRTDSFEPHYVRFLEFVLSPECTIAVCVGIFLLGLLFAFNYRIRVNPLKRNLIKARQAVEETPWDSLEDRFIPLGHTLRSLFKAYSLHVVPQAGDVSLTGGADPRNLAEEDGLSEENAAAGTPVLCPRSLRASDEFFTEDNVYYAEINAPFYQSVPGMLTGLGIFFTFVGLAAGVTLATKGLISTESGAIGAGGLDLMLQSIGNLLDGAGQAFFSSIAGLFTSLIFGMKIHKHEHEISALIADLNDAFEEKAPVISQNELLFGLLRRSIRQEETIADLKVSADNWVSNLIDSINKSGEDQTRQLLESFAGVSESISKMGDLQIEKLAATIDMFEGKLLGAFDKMTVSFRETAQGVGTVIEGLESATETARNVMKEAYDASNASLAKLTGELEAINGRIVGTAEQVFANMEAAKTSSEAFAQNVTASSEAFSANVSGSGEAFSSSVAGSGEAFSTAVSGSGAAFSTAVSGSSETFSKSLADASGALAGKLDEGAEALSAGMKAGADTFGTEAANAAEALGERLTEAGTAFGETLSAEAKAFGSSVAQSGASFRKNVDESAANLTASVDAIAASFEAAAAEQKAIASAFHTVTPKLAENVGTLNGMLDKAKSTVEALAANQAAVEKAFTSLLEAVQKGLATTQEGSEHQRDSFNALAEKLQVLTNRSLQIFEENQEALKLLRDTHEKGLEFIADAFERFNKSLDVNLHNADKAFSSAVTTLNTVVSEMNEGNGKLGKIVDGLKTSADVFSAESKSTKEAAEVLSASLERWRTSAKERSDALGGSVTALQSSMSNLQKAMEAQNAAKAQNVSEMR